jgi:peroxiredoxin/uncharacterized membrane protein YphA (DoxX/SURF4 family)
MDSFLVGAQLLLAVVFVTAGVGKLLDQQGSRVALAGFGVPEPVVRPAGLLLPLAEIAAAVLLVLHDTARWGGVAALALLIAFVAGIASAMAQGRAPDCHCFGQIHSAPAGRGTLIRNALLAALAVVVVARGPAPAIDGWVAARSAAELVAIGLGVISAVLAGTSVRLWLDKRDLNADLARERKRTALFPAGLPAGAYAPRFELPTLGGEMLSLESLLERGRQVALFFVSPGCGPCTTVLPDIGRWQSALSDRLTMAIVSSGTAEDNQALAEKYGLTDVMLQEDAEVLESYFLSGTPAAVVVTRDGLLASSSANGAYAIEPLIRLTLRDETTAAPIVPHAAANGRPKQSQSAA